MQYVGQTGRYLKTGFREHFRKMKKPKKFDTFLYRHFKNNGHSPSKIVIQTVKKIQTRHIVYNQIIRKNSLTHISLVSFLGAWANSAYPDQTPQNATHDQGLLCLLTHYSVRI